MKQVQLAAGVTQDQFDALLSTANFMIGDLFRFDLVTGLSDFFTALDIPVTWGGNVYKANSLRIWGLKFKQAIGLDVDEQEVKIAYYPGETLCGADFVVSAITGLLDGAYLTRSRAFWAPSTGNPSFDYTASPLGIVQLSYGRISEISQAGRTQFTMKVKSPLVLLDIELPRNYYQPSCTHTLFDVGCTLSKAAFGVNGVVDVGTTRTGFPWQGGVPIVTGADGIAYYASGRLLFTSGVFSGEQFFLEGNDAANLYPAYPFSQAPGIGDTFTAYPGCSKSPGTCTTKFSNFVNFRGFPRVPPVNVAL